MDERSFRARSSHDPAEFLHHAGSLLRARPVHHGVLLNNAAGRAERGERGERGEGDEANLWLWVEADGEVVAAAQHTPPYGAYLSTGPAGAVRVLARVLWEQRPWLPGVGGLEPGPAQFAAEWARLGGPAAELARAEGVYVADHVIPPSQVDGGMRQARPEEAGQLCEWAAGFLEETDEIPGRGGAEELVGQRLDAGRLFVWEAGSEVVSMAAVTAPYAGVSRVQLVYTPPERRRHGYAAACVAALTARELGYGDRVCMLYTDLANPTSNKIYQQVGYQRVGDAVQLRFPQGG